MSYRRYPKYDARKYQCCILPWLKARHIHHTSYKGPEKLYVDMLPVSVFAHWLIHGVGGGSLWMNKAVTRQNYIARRLPLAWLWKYPNPIQRVIHLWGRIPNVVKWAVLALEIWWRLGLSL